MERLTAQLDWFTHGWHAFIGAWLVVLVGTWAGLWLRGANRRRYLTAPIAAAFVALLAMLAAAALKTGMDAANIVGPLRAYGTFTIFPLFGLLASLLSSDPARTVIHRGAVIQDGRPAQRRGRGGELTLAGIPIPATGETKHFKLIGTTGTGKSTAIRELLAGALARGDREVIRPTVSRTRKGGLFAEPGHSVSRGEQHVTESAVLPAEIEQLPDLAGYLKFASHAAWLRVRLSPP